MPHVVIKLWTGQTEEKKQDLVEKIAKDVIEVIGCQEEAVSIAMEETKPEDWAEKVYKPDILGKVDTLYKKPGYNPLGK